MAEREGFEPSVRVTPHNSLAGCHLRPLGHLSNKYIYTQNFLAEGRGFEPPILSDPGFQDRLLTTRVPSIFEAWNIDSSPFLSSPAR